LSDEKKEEKFDLYALKRSMNKKRRELRNSIIGTDTVDGSSMMRTYGEATKTRRALKVQFFNSKSKASKYGDDTSIEVFVYNILDEIGVEYIKQKAIRYHNVDAYVPDYNTIIQIHGCYHHGCPECYLVPKNNIQRKNIEKDKAANVLFEKEKHILMEIWEHEILNDPEKVKERLRSNFSK
jgi:DNA mismatch endonuclease (patch repair protein)